MIHHSCRFWRTFNGHMTPISYGVMSLGHFRAVLISTVFSGHGVIATVMPYKIDACVLPIGIKLVQIVVSSCQIGGTSRAFATAKHVYVLGEICCYCICCQQCLHLILNHNLLLKSLTSCSIHLFCYNCHGIFMVKIQIFAGQVPSFFPAKLWQSGRQVVGECWDGRTDLARCLSQALSRSSCCDGWEIWWKSSMNMDFKGFSWENHGSKLWILRSLT